MSFDLKALALEMRDEGLSVIPTKENKAPSIPAWTEYQKRLPTPEEIEGWTWKGIGVVCGTVSENLCCIDIDTKNDKSGSLIRDYFAAVNLVAPGLFDRLVIEETVNHGRHILFKSPTPIPTKDLALEVDRGVIIETRGEGAYFVCAPSKGYTLKQGKIEAAPFLDQWEVDALLNAAESLTRYAPEPVNVPRPSEHKDGLRPLDDYDQKAGIGAIADMLVARGWKVLNKRGDAYSLSRPGKTERGISATLNHVPGRLYVFSTSTEFEARRAYKPSQVYAILTCGGDFHQAATELYSLGFGERKGKAAKKPVSDSIQAPVALSHDTTEQVRLVRVKDLQAGVMALYARGMDKGLTTGFPNMDGLIRVVKGQLNILTGIPSHGKSEWLDALMVNLATVHGWRCCVFSPENYPIELHIRKLAEKVMGRAFSTPMGKAPQAEIEKALEFLDKHFVFVNVGEADIDLEGILAIAGSEPFDLVLIDPWNEIGESRAPGESEGDYIGKSLRRIRKFARQRKLSFWIAAHPTKIKKDDKTNNTPAPTMYDISGSAHWYNKADNGFCVYRDFIEDSTEVKVLKVKFKFYGQTGSAKFKYEAESGRFAPWTAHDEMTQGVKEEKQQESAPWYSKD